MAATRIRLLVVLASIHCANTKLRRRRHGHRADVPYVWTPQDQIHFIHVGKCGGSFVDHWLHKHKVPHHSHHRRYHGFREFLDNRSALRSANASLYILWVRDPVARFQSAFEYQRAVITTDVSNYSLDYARNRPRHPLCQLGPRCLAPGKLFVKKKTGYAYNREFDALNLHFPSANSLAEALSSPDDQRRSWAKQLMERDEEHIKFGLAWHLGENGQFVQQHHGKMFVGVLEHSQEFLLALAARLLEETERSPASYGQVMTASASMTAALQESLLKAKTQLQSAHSGNNRKLRHNTHTVPLSALAIHNLGR